LIQVSNLGRQGKPEIETIQEIEDISRGIIEKERSVRKMFMRENPIQVRDHIGRALGWPNTLGTCLSPNPSTFCRLLKLA
jgi:protein-arginine kinase